MPDASTLCCLCSPVSLCIHDLGHRLSRQCDRPIDFFLDMLLSPRPRSWQPTGCLIRIHSFWRASCIQAAMLKSRGIYDPMFLLNKAVGCTWVKNGKTKFARLGGVVVGQPQTVVYGTINQRVRSLHGTRSAHRCRRRQDKDSHRTKT